MNELQTLLNTPFYDLNFINKKLDEVGLKFCCKVCGNATFVEKEFDIPIEDIIDKELSKQLKEYTSNNSNPTRR
jgi:hypothetical protein